MSAKLLLADDSPAIRRVVEMTFANEDIQVVAVGDGEQAVARIPIERPDVVVAAIEMPRRTGYEVAAFVRNHSELSHVPVLLLAGAFEPVDQARIEQTRPAGVLVKPFDPRQVVARVRDLVKPARDTAGSQAPRAGAAAATPLDDYFDRLDAAFATLGARQADAAQRAEWTGVAQQGSDDGVPAFPTLDGLLAGGAPAPLHTATPAVPGRAAGGSLGPGAHAEVSRRSPEPKQSQSASGHDQRQDAGVREPAAISEELIEAVTRRVIERLATGAARPLLVPIVSEIAERHVRDELDRIRNSNRNV